MASRNLGTLTLDLIARTGQFNAGMTAAERRTQAWAKNIGQILANVRGQVQGLLAGIAVVATVQKIVAATVEAENAIRQLEARLRSTGGIAGVTSQELQALARELQGLTTYTADAILGMQGVLLTFQNIRGENVEAATRAVLDLSAALGQDLQSSAAQVGRALNDPIKGINALQKIGVTFSTAQKQLIKSLADAGNIAAAQNVILKQLSVAYGGAAEAAGNTLGGALQQLKNSFDNLFTAEDGVDELTDAIQDLNAAIQAAGVSESFQAFTSLVVRALGNIADTITVVVNAFNWFAENRDKMFLFPQLEYVLKEFRILGTDLERINDEIEFFEEQRDSFLPWVLSLEEGVMNLDDINEKLRELYRERGRIEQQTLRFGARSPPRRGGPAKNRPIEGDEDALESLRKLTESMQQQIATFDKGAAAVMRYRIEAGDLAETFKLARADGEKFREPLIALAADLERLQNQKAIEEQIKQLRDQTAVLDLNAEKTMRYRIVTGDLAETFQRAGAASQQMAADLIAAAKQAEEATNQLAIEDMVQDLRTQIATFGKGEAAAVAYRIAMGDLARTFDNTTEAGRALADEVINLTLQMQLLKDIAESVDETIDAMSESLQESLDKFSDDFEARFLERRDVLLDFMEGLAAGTENILADALESGFEGGAKGILKSFGALLQRLIAEAIAADLAKRLFGTIAGGTGTGWLGMLAGAVSGKASGGPIQAGMPYLVGERGPEIIVPSRSATVIPNNRIGAQNNYITLTVQTPTGRVPMETQQQLGNRLARALGEARRRNG